MLQEDPQDQTVALLRHISLQMTAFSINQSFVNSTVPCLTPPPFHVPKGAVAVNIMWFLSLSLSLMAALLSILVLQWIRHYRSFPLVSNEVRACLRQCRFDALERWRVPLIVSSLSVVLQLALILFLAGMITLLWMYHPLTCYAVSSVIALYISALIVVTVIPSFTVGCPYKSPLAWIAHPIIYYVALPSFHWRKVLSTLHCVWAGLRKSPWRGCRTFDKTYCGHFYGRTGLASSWTNSRSPAPEWSQSHGSFETTDT